jgi:hypothetical protein
MVMVMVLALVKNPFLISRVDTVFINGYVVFSNDKGANFLIGTLSAADIDTAAAALTFTAGGFKGK